MSEHWEVVETTHVRGPRWLVELELRVWEVLRICGILTQPEPLLMPVFLVLTLVSTFLAVQVFRDSVEQVFVIN